MRNSEKFTTAEERAEAFEKWCESNHEHGGSFSCLRDSDCCECHFEWLDMEAEVEKIENCPYCGGKCYILNNGDGRYRVSCHADLSCRYSSSTYTTEHEAIAHHNRVARAVMAAEMKKEVQ